MNKKNTLIIILIVVLFVSILTGCSQASRVSANVSKEADNFNVIRRLVVTNGRTDAIVFELVGAFSFELTNNRIIATVQTGENEYKKHSVGLPDEAFWFVEDISGANVDSFRYEVNFLPEMLIPFEITQSY